MTTVKWLKTTKNEMRSKITYLFFWLSCCFLDQTTMCLEECSLRFFQALDKKTKKLFLLSEKKKEKKNEAREKRIFFEKLRQSRRSVFKTSICQKRKIGKRFINIFISSKVKFTVKPNEPPFCTAG